MPDFIRLPDCVISLSHVRLIEFEGDVVLVHWACSENHLVLRGDDGSFFLDALERRYGVVVTDLAALYSDSSHCDEANSLNNILTTA